jgi:hypothetical protein
MLHHPDFQGLLEHAPGQIKAPHTALNLALAKLWCNPPTLDHLKMNG